MINNYGYIYKTTNLVNGKVYIGQKRGGFNLSYFGSGLIIKRAIKKEGKEAFKREFIVYAFNKEQLDFLEKKFIKNYRELLGKENLYNITDGGGGFCGHHTLETKIKMSKPKTLATIAKMCKPKTPEAIVNIRIARKKRQDREKLEKLFLLK